MRCYGLIQRVEMEIQSILSEIITLAKQESDATQFLQKAFVHLLSATSDTFKVDDSTMLIRENNQLLAVANFNSFATKCSIDGKGKCACRTLTDSDKIINCNYLLNNDGEVKQSNLCIPFRRNNTTVGAYIFQIPKALNTSETVIFELFKNLIESYAVNKLKEAELQKKAQQQDILNQTLFAQSLEIDQKNIEIEENERKIKEQYEELQTAEEELRQNNEELQVLLESVENQKEELEELNESLTQSNAKIANAHREIVDSINYAKTIQQALLTSNELVKNYLPESFILYTPKDRISGDFYYVNQFVNKIIVAVADCTGHSVAGAFLTILGITYLHEAVRQKDRMKPSEILNFLRERFKRTFKTFGSNTRNGLDIALCELDTETKILKYAGANNPLWLIRNNELIEYKATKNPIGFYPSELQFELHEINVHTGDLIYLFSDGFRDQFGGIQERKYSAPRFKELLLSICNLPMQEQKQQLETIHTEWKGNNIQTDDILVLGFKI